MQGRTYQKYYFKIIIFFYKIKLINIKKKSVQNLNTKQNILKKIYQDKPIELFFEDGHKINLFWKKKQIVQNDKIVKANEKKKRNI